MPRETTNSGLCRRFLPTVAPPIPPLCIIRVSIDLYRATIPPAALLQPGVAATISCKFYYNTDGSTTAVVTSQRQSPHTSDQQRNRCVCAIAASRQPQPWSADSSGSAMPRRSPPARFFFSTGRPAISRFLLSNQAGTLLRPTRPPTALRPARPRPPSPPTSGSLAPPPPLARSPQLHRPLHRPQPGHRRRLRIHPHQTANN